MAILTLQQAKDYAKQPAGSDSINLAILHEQRIRMHTQSEINRDAMSSAHERFLSWVDGLLDEENKKRRFRQLYTLPIATNDLCDKIFLEYPRVLEAQDKYIKNTFTSEAAEQDFKLYLEESNYYKTWQNDGMNALRKYINCFVVCDLPAIQTEGRPAPYFYFLHIDAVHDVGFNDKGDVEYIEFWQPMTQADAALLDTDGKAYTGKLAVFDDTTIRFLYKTEQGEFVQLSPDIRHNQPWCPVCKFYPDMLDKDSPCNSKAPITDSLGELDNLLLDIVSIRYYEKYGMFPIYWGYKAKCEYVDPRSGGTCNGSGTIIYQTVPIGDEESQTAYMDCPNCKASRLMGPGSFIEVDPPTSKEDADLREPVGKIDVQVEALQFMQTKVQNSKYEILYNTTGATPVTQDSKQAVNIPQVLSTLESRKAVLVSIKKNFERTMQFTLECLARYRYGNQFVSSTVDLGTDYFLMTEEEMNTDYQANKDAGMPQYVLADKQDFMLNARYSNNPEKMQRIAVMRALEPWQTLTLSEVVDLGLAANKEQFIIKSNLSSFVDRFEREQKTTIVQFASAISFDQKINIILQTFKSYSNEYTVQTQAGTAASNQTQTGSV